MPFHAAGKHADSLENAYYRALSSYTPSIRALAYSRESKATKATDGPVLIVTMPTTPGMSKLPAVETEKCAIIQAIDGQRSVVSLTAPDASKVLENMVDCSIAHFACHGFTDPTDPSNSGLVFQNHSSQNSTEAELLTFQDISSAKLKCVDIAYLSACSTAQNPVPQLADEAIHIVSGFQVAGFRQVIGCLWRSSDQTCLNVARGFYERLFNSRNLPWNNRDVAAALHESILDVKDKYPRRPLLWAQFVHYGA
jgi:CHAT domain-containing protein